MAITRLLRPETWYDYRRRRSGAILVDAEVLAQLPEHVLFRIERGDANGRAFGTPRNPRVPTLTEFNPRFIEVRGGDLPAMIVERKHGIFPEQAERIGQLTDVELIQFRVDDPISATEVEHGLSLTGGHHRTHEICRRAQNGQMSPATLVRILLHD